MSNYAAPMLARADNATAVAPGRWPEPYDDKVYKVCYTKAEYASQAKTCCTQVGANSSAATGGVTNCLLKETSAVDEFFDWSKCLTNETHLGVKEIGWNCQRGAAAGLRVGLGGLLAIVATAAVTVLTL